MLLKNGEANTVSRQVILGRADDPVTQENQL